MNEDKNLKKLTMVWHAFNEVKEAKTWDARRAENATNNKPMELKEFIKTALADITNAVSELQAELQNGAIVSPSLPKDGENTIVIDNRNVILTQVAFDVAITAGGTDTIKGGAKGGLHVFSAKVDGSNEGHTENVSHVSFSIPIVLPQTASSRSKRSRMRS